MMTLRLDGYGYGYAYIMEIEVFLKFVDKLFKFLADIFNKEHLPIYSGPFSMDFIIKPSLEIVLLFI